MTADQRPWYERAFDRVYREVYPHRSDAQADAEVAFAETLFNLEFSEQPLLDLCCGHGRHALAWNQRQVPVVGLDLSWDLIEAAHQRGLPQSFFLRGDMRLLPFQANVFQAATSFFTSFGYFEDESDDLRVLREIQRVLKPQAPFILDFLNAVKVRETLVPSSTSQRAGYHIEENRRIDEDNHRVIKDVRVQDAEGQNYHYEESVRLYDQEELVARCRDAGLHVQSSFGDLNGAAFSAPESDRLVLFGFAS